MPKVIATDARVERCLVSGLVLRADGAPDRRPVTITPQSVGGVSGAYVSDAMVKVWPDTAGIWSVLLVVGVYQVKIGGVACEMLVPAAETADFERIVRGLR